MGAGMTWGTSWTGWGNSWGSTGSAVPHLTLPYQMSLDSSDTGLTLFDGNMIQLESGETSVTLEDE